MKDFTTLILTDLPTDLDFTQLLDDSAELLDTLYAQELDREQEEQTLNSYRQAYC